MTLANAYFSSRLGQARNNSQIGSVKALIGFRHSSFSQAVFFFVSLIVFLLINCQVANAGTHSAGANPGVGRGIYISTAGPVTNCSLGGCHSDTPNTSVRFPNFSTIANSASDLIAQLDGNAVGIATMGGVTGERVLTAKANAASLSAYFASTLAPQVNRPLDRTLNSASTAVPYNQAITAPLGSDFLVSTTQYEVTAGVLPTGFSITGSPGVAAAFTGTIPANNTAIRGVFSVTFRAVNTNAGTSAVINGPTQQFNITVNAAQIINFVAVPTVRFNGTGTITATGGASSNNVTFTPVDPNQCTVSGTTKVGANFTATVRGVTVGTNNCRILANQNADLPNNFLAATQQETTFSILRADQTIDFTAPTSVVVGNTPTLSAIVNNTATGLPSGLAVTFSTPANPVCDVVGTTLTAKTAGTCTVTASQAGNGNFNAATPIVRDILIGTANQIINFTAPTGVVVGNTPTLSATVNNTATGLPSGLAVTFSTPANPVCDVVGTTLTAKTAGTCTVTASQAGNGNFNAAPNVVRDIVIGRANQLIVFDGAPSIVVGGSGIVSSSGGASTNPVLYTTASSACSVSATSSLVSGKWQATVTGLASGNCAISATQLGDSNFNAASTTNLPLFSIGVGTQTITFGASPTLSVNGAGVLTASASSNLPVTFSTSSAACSVSTATLQSGATWQTNVTALLAGSNVCVVTATQVGDSNFSAVSSSRMLSIAQGNQSINFSAPTDVIVKESKPLSATAVPSNLAVTFTASPPERCSLTGNSVNGLAAGDCTITANQVGDINYNPASAIVQTITIGRGNQTISFSPPSAIVVNGSTTLTATSSESLIVSFSTSTGTVCQVSGNMVTALTAGNCQITASQAGNVNFNAAPSVTQTLAIGQGAQAINFVGVPSVVVGGVTAVIANGGNSGNAVTFSSSTPTACSVTGNEVSGIRAGTNNCSIVANQLGNANFTAANPETLTFSVGQSNQTITFGNAPTLVEGGTGVVTATSSSGLAVSLTVPNTTSICSISGNTVTALAIGVCTVAADQAGNVNFAAAPQQTQNINIGAAPVTASAVSIDVPLNTPTTVNLAPFIAGSAVTGIKILSQPSLGAVTSNATSITYTPKTDAFGTDALTYSAFGSTGESAAAIITVNIIGRPDPTQNQNVRNLMSNQMATAQRFNRAQSLNFQQRMETLHGRFSSRQSANSQAVAAVPKGTTLGDVEARSIAMRIEENQSNQFANVQVPQINAKPNSINATVSSAGALSQSSESVSNTNQQANIVNANTFTSRMASNPAMVADSRPVSDGEALAEVLNGSIGNALMDTLRNKNINLAALSNAVLNSQSANDPNAVEIWMAGNVRVGSVEQTGFDFSNYKTDGISVGLDKPFGDNLVLGLGLSYAHDSSELASDGSKAMAKGLSLSVYGSYQAAENTYIDAMLGYGKIDYQSKRFVSSVGSFAEANRDGDQLFASIAGAYEYKNQGLMLSPYARLDLSYNRLDSTTESGAGLNALRYGDSTARFIQVSAGMRAEANHQADFGIITPRARLEYQASTQSNDDTNIQYADQLGGNFRLAGTTNRQGSIVFGLGADMLMKNGIRLGLDYQSLRSPGTESSQALSFRLAKDLGVVDNKLPILDIDSLSIPKLGVRLDMGYTYDDNVNRSRENAEKLQDRVYSFNLNKGKNININANSRIVLNGFFGAEKSYYFRGLDKVNLGAQAEYQYKTSGSFSAPTYGVFTRITTEQFNSELRDGVRLSSGLTLRKPLTDKLSTFAALAYNKRNANNEVFDLEEVSIRANLDYLTLSDSTIYLTGELRHGDIVSTGRPSLENLDGSDANVLDDVFQRQGFASYRFKGDTALATLGYNIPIGPADGLDFSWRWVRSTPSDVPNYVRDKRSYYNNQFSIVYLVRF